MIERLSWCALLLAALAALAWWGPALRPACDESRPVFGAGVCCQAHKVAGVAASAAAERRASLGLPARISRRGTRRAQTIAIA